MSFSLGLEKCVKISEALYYSDGPIFFLTVWQHEAYWLVKGTIAPALCNFSISV